MTIFSPKVVGSDETRRSISRFWNFTESRPSWGSRRSAMSRFDMILTRERMAGSICFGGFIMSWSTPSIRYRTRKTFSYGSRWMSEARFRMASAMIRLTKRIVGASSASRPSSAMSTFEPLSTSSRLVSMPVDSWSMSFLMSSTPEL